MSKLTQLQTDLLNLLAQSDGGAVPPAATAKATILAMTKRGFIDSVDDGDGEIRITLAGRAHIAPAPEGEMPGGTARHAPPCTAPTVDEPDIVRAAAVPQPKGKIAIVLSLLRRPIGATIADLMSATGWQAHSVRGAMSGAVKKKLGIAIESEKVDGARIYRVVAEVAA